MKAYLLQSPLFITEILNVVHCLGTECSDLLVRQKQSAAYFHVFHVMYVFEFTCKEVACKVVESHRFAGVLSSASLLLVQ